MIKNIILWALLCIVIGALIGCEFRYSNGHAEAPPAEYRLMCDTETKRAYVTYKHWSAHVPQRRQVLRRQPGATAPNHHGDVRMI